MPMLFHLNLWPERLPLPRKHSHRIPCSLIQATCDQPVPAQVRHNSVAPRRPLPSHLWHACAGCVTETLPFPPHTRHEITRLAEVAERPVPAHHAHVSGA
jgi:hypothetical protein